MSLNSEISWTNHTWPVIRGCSKVSPGCKFCWAIRDAHLHAGNKNPKMQQHFAGLTVIENGSPNWTGKVRLDESILDWPLRWKKPSMIFAASSGDLWHERLSWRFDITQVYATMYRAHWHTYQVLTKRPEIRLEVMQDRHFWEAVSQYAGMKCEPGAPHIWEGVSIEDPPTADERIPILLQTPAALRFVSYEPALAEVDFTRFLPVAVCSSTGRLWAECDCGWCERGPSTKIIRRGLDWIIVGGESGPQARPCDLSWIRSTRDQCKAAGVPLFCKQLGSKPVQSGEGLLTTRYPLKDRKGGDPQEWPADLRDIREFPDARR